MAVTLTIGWWVIPFIITLLAILWAFFSGAHETDTFGLGTVLRFIGSLILTLSAWVIYLVIRVAFGII